MQVTPAMTVSSSNVPVSAGAAAQLLVSDSELASSGSFMPVEEVTVSEEARNPDMRRPKQDDTYAPSGSALAEDAADGQSAAADEQELLEIRQLQQRDQEVRAHEQAHASVGGVHAGASSFTYATGPDGVRYAVAGEVSVDVSRVAGDPQATIDKMEQLQRAALAPAEPSPQDRRVASQAGQMAAQALTELAEEQRSVREAEISRLQTEQDTVRQELQAAKEEQKQAEEKENTEERISADERFAEANARLRRINEFLLEISLPQSVSAGQIFDDVV